MPLTFPSHLAPVLPLKLWRPRWFDGVALATGAVAPDVGYLFAGTRLDPGSDTHTLAGLLWWCLPVALGYAWLVRRTVAGIAVHLPGEQVFGWRRYAALRGVRHPWRITVCSALLGATSHLGWDWLTHTDRWLRLFGIQDFYAASTGGPSPTCSARSSARPSWWAWRFAPAVGMRGLTGYHHPRHRRGPRSSGGWHWRSPPWEWRCWRDYPPRRCPPRPWCDCSTWPRSR
ncbi:DUF4184 family protein [Micromonospora globispora]|uniref:DUF4184 family protein n=1 Tax=Micromonospora globispora TaxID=1450148 RepID=UPI001FAEF016|nr:DUF4184 family protein [Micromonospora globispora]